MDLKDSKENIKTFSNEKLILEGIIKRNDYIPEVAELFDSEINNRKITFDEIENEKKKYINNNIKNDKKITKLRGFLLFIVILLFIEFFVFLLAGIVSIRNFGIISTVLVFGISICCLLTSILIIKKKKIAKKIFIVLMLFDIFNCLIIICISIVKNIFVNIGINLFTILKNSLFIFYFVKSEYVNKYLEK